MNHELLQRIRNDERLNLHLDVGVPAVLCGLNIDTVKPLSGQETAHARLLETLGGGRGAYLHSDVGHGKTYLAAAMICTAIDANPHLPRMPDPAALFVSWRSLLHDQRSQASDGYGDGRMMMMALGVPLVVIDDFGSGNPTDFALETAERLLDERYNTGGRTIITGNLTLNQLAARWGDRTASRVAGLCRVVHVGGNDHRIDGARRG